LAVLDDLAVSRGDESGSGTNYPGRGLHGSSRKAGTALGESDPGCGADENGDDIDFSQDAMKFEVSLADSRREIDGANQQSEGSGKCMRNEKMAVGYNLQSVSVIHWIISDEEPL
jgi:hypothetical protein